MKLALVCSLMCVTLLMQAVEGRYRWHPDETVRRNDDNEECSENGRCTAATRFRCCSHSCVYGVCALEESPEEA